MNSMYLRIMFSNKLFALWPRLDVHHVQLKKKYIVQIEWDAMSVWLCLRRACFLRVRGAFAAWVRVAADILRDGHGQDVGRRLHHRLKTPNVAPSADNSGDGKVKLALGGAARAEQPELEPLLVTCSRRQRRSSSHESPPLQQRRVWFWPYCCLGATASGTRSHQRTAICLSTGCWQSARRGSGPMVAGPGRAPPAARSVFGSFWWTCAARRWSAGGKPRWFVVSPRCWRA